MHVVWRIFLASFSVLLSVVNAKCMIVEPLWPWSVSALGGRGGVEERGVLTNVPYSLEL